MEDLLKKAREYELQYLNEHGTDRPMFHITSPVGWVNDPNGFSLYQGEYHLFYQYHPYEKVWGSMHWGHAKTKDFIKWKQLPAVMAPDEFYDNEGCFSGSALEIEGKHYLMYTGVSKTDKGMMQEQCLAVGNGREYKKVENNPIITADMLPKGYNIHDFRDPKLYVYKNGYRAVIGAKNKKDIGQVVVFESQDLKKWEFISVLDSSENKLGKMWECPDLFELNGNNILIASPQFMQAEGLEFHNGNGTICITGKIIEEKIIRENVHAVDYGFDFYAPQTLKTPDGRRIMIGWLQSWDNYLTPDELKWSGMMSIPRELSMAEGRLCQKPVQELEKYRRNRVFHQVELKNQMISFEDIRGRIADIKLTIKNACCDSFEIIVAGNEKYETKLILDQNLHTLTVDRTFAGFKRDVVCVRTMKIGAWELGTDLRIVLDKYSIEVFVSEGRYVMSTVIFTELDADEIKFKAKGNINFAVEKYNICLIS